MCADVVATVNATKGPCPTRPDCDRYLNLVPRMSPLMYAARIRFSCVAMFVNFFEADENRPAYASDDADMSALWNADALGPVKNAATVCRRCSAVRIADRLCAAVKAVLRNCIAACCAAAAPC